MTRTNTPQPDHLDQLMVDAATQGLSPQDEAELSAALERDPSLRFEAEAYELAATAIDLALTKPATDEALPAGLRDKLIASAGAFAAARSVDNSPGLRLAGTRAAPQPASPMKPRFSWTDGRAFGWYAAAVALLAFVIAITTPKPTDNTPGKRMTLAEQYQSLVQSPRTIAAKWGFNADAGDPRFAGAKGEVIWNPDQQAGYMKLAGLPINDPTKEQYQLWIVDPARDAEPIDGGVFDITAAGEVIVPINAKLRSDKPVVFAITIEQPGGVVVSEGPLQVVAAVSEAG